MLIPTTITSSFVSKLAAMIGKAAAESDVETVYDLAGRLYLSRSGWLLLSVPNSLATGAFDALDAQGIELPKGPGDGPFNAHISVMRADEVDRIGAKNITERGHSFRYTLGRVRSATPKGWDEISKVWFIEVKSPELERLRKSYGLEGLPVHPFHITVAVRKKNVLVNSDVIKQSENGDDRGEVQDKTDVQTGSDRHSTAGHSN